MNRVLYKGPEVVVIEINSLKNLNLKCTIDTEDYEKIKSLNWWSKKSGRNHYVYTHDRKTRKSIFLHRLIMNADGEFIVDHITGDTLDNRKENLRICKQFENVRNQQVHFDKKIPYKGVINLGPRFTIRPYLARITIDYKTFYLGYYKTAEEAALAYNEAAVRYHGKFARLNKIGLQLNMETTVV